MATRAAHKGAFNFSVTIGPSPEKLAKSFGRLADDFGDWRPAFRILAPHLAAGIAQNISSRGAAIGESWPASDPAYLRRKQRNGFGSADLVLTGMLQRFATNASTGVLTMTPKAMRFGVQLPHARAVNFGRSGGNRGRRFMGWNPAMKSAFETAASSLARARLEKLAGDLEASRGG